MALFRLPTDRQGGKLPVVGAIQAIVGTAIVLGVALIGLYTLTPADRTLTRPSMFGVLVMLAVAAAAAGAFIGFLFGIPRSMPEIRPMPPGPDGDEPARSYQANTNLEQISDWVTKILVGVGLIQLGRSTEPIGRLVDNVAAGIGGRPADRLMAATILVMFSIFGFLAGYLLTRLLVLHAFTVADRTAVIATIEAGLERQQYADAEAHSLVARTLQPPPGAEVPSQQELTKVLSKASPVVRSQVFSAARLQRRADEDSPAGRANLGRAILVFRALVEAEPGYHRNHSQLAYALRYSEPPQLAEAERSFTTGIDRRGPAAEAGWLFYEMNRAAVRIEMDLSRSAPATPDRISAILTDLHTAARNPHVLAEIRRDPMIQTWLTVNVPDPGELRSDTAPP